MTREIKGLDGLRRIAAVIIALFHLYLLMPSSGLPLQNALMPIYQYGWLMVEFFYVLSGFLSFHGFSKSRGIEDFPRFMYRKLARIYPVHVMTLITCAVLAVVATLFSLTVPLSANTVVNFVLNLFFVHYVGVTPPTYSFNLPAWYLCNLMICYVISFVIHAKCRSNGSKVLTSFGVLVVGLVCFRMYELFPSVYFPFVNLDMGRALVSFFAGGLLHELLSIAVTNKRAKTLAAIGSMVILLGSFGSVFLLSRNAGICESYTGNYRLFLSLLTFPAVITAVVVVKGLAFILDMPVIKWVGQKSYSIFMWHYPIILMGYLCNSIFALNIPYHHPLFLVVYFVVVFSVAALSVRYIENPGKRWLLSHEEQVITYLHTEK